MASVRKSLAYSFLDQYAALVIGVISSMVLARLLTPEEVGIFSVTMVFVGIVSALRDFGAQGFIVREPNLTEDHIRAARTLQFAIGFSLAIVVFLIATPVARFYENAAIESVMHIMALNFMVIPFGSIIIALWKRDMAFHKIAIARFVSAVAAASSAIYLAMNGFGELSLAWSAIISQTASVTTCYLLWRGGYSMWPGVKKLKEVLSVGTKLTGNGILMNLTEHAPEMALGKLQDLTTVGFFTRGQGLVALFRKLVMSAVGPVAFPAFARIHRSGGDVISLYLKATDMVTVIGWPFFVVLAIIAFPAIRILYGDQWDMAVPITQILCIAAALWIPAILADRLLTAVGNLNTVVKLSAFTLSTTAVASVIGGHFGLFELGIGLAIAALLNTGVRFRTLAKSHGLILRDVVNLFVRNGAITTFTIIPFLVLSSAYEYEGGVYDLGSLITAALFSTIIYYYVTRRLQHPIAAEIDMVVQYLNKKIGLK